MNRSLKEKDPNLFVQTHRRSSVVFMKILKDIESQTKLLSNIRNGAVMC